MAARRWLLAAAFALVWLMADTQSSDAAQKEPIRIVALGDSTTAPGLGIEKVYAERLAEGLNALGLDVEVINAGISGNTTADARARFEADVLARGPDIVIIQFGLNDSAIDVAQGKTAPRIPESEYRDNLDYFAKTLKGRGARPILMTPNPKLWTDLLKAEVGKPPYDPELRWGLDGLNSRYAETVREVARANDVPLVDVHQAYLDYDQSEGQSAEDLYIDGIHPNDKGHELAAKMLVGTIAAMSGPQGKPERRPATPVSSAYRLVWSDEFDGDKLDETKWSHRDLGPRRDAINTEDAVTLDGQGHLLITTSRAEKDDGSVEYHTGMIRTQDKFEATYGYFEARMKVQSQIGHWSAFWLQSPDMGKYTGEPAKAGAEIDIIEYLCNGANRNKAQHTIHWDGYGEDHKSRHAEYTAPDMHSGFHTFGLEWTPTEYIFYVDGKETWRTSEAISRRDEYIILSAEVGKWAGDIAEADLPDAVVFDYVRVYQKPEGE
jgi:lysophospholipase L1-like esterase/beta-glucanase (GH16 family)